MKNIKQIIPIPEGKVVLTPYTEEGQLPFEREGWMCWNDNDGCVVCLALYEEIAEGGFPESPMAQGVGAYIITSANEHIVEDTYKIVYEEDKEFWTKKAGAEDEDKWE